MITRIDITGYKSIKNLSIELKPINILIGSNGVGKSNFISVFSFIKNLYQGNIQNFIEKKGGADSFLHFGKKNTQKIGVDFYFGDKNNNPENRFIVELENAQDSLLIRKVSTAFFNGIWHYNLYEKDVKESKFSEINIRQAFWVNNRLREFDVYHFHDTGDTSPMKGRSNVEDSSKLKNDGSNIAAFLYFLKERHNKHYLRIEKTIQSIAPFFEKFDLKPSRLNQEFIQLEWKEKGFPDSYFNAYHLSDGTLRFICLATLLMQPNPPKTIIIDEPELGLHPVAINILASLIRKISATTQVIISTQSTNFIDNFEPEEIIVTDREQNSSVFKHLDSPSLHAWLEEFTLGDLWGKNMIGGQPYYM